MSVFADALDLRTAVVELVSSTAIVPVFLRLVGLFEIEANRRLTLSRQVTQGSVTFAGGSAALPSDYLRMIRLGSPTTTAYSQRPPGGDVRSGDYAIVGQTITGQIADGAVPITYLAALPSIAGSLAATSWLLSEAPSLYLYGVGFEAAKFLLDVDRAGRLEAMRDAEFSAASADDLRKRYSQSVRRAEGATP